MRSSSRTPWIIGGLILITVMVYANVRTFDFVSYDDPWYITNNPNLIGGLTAKNIWWAFTAGYLFYWHPITWLSHLLDVQIFGLNPAGHHVTSLLLHVTAALLLFGFLRRTTGSEGRSAFVAALFAIHPLHVESVAWIAERKDVLSTVFLMLTMWAYVRYGANRTVRNYLLVVLCFVLGLMAKPMLVTLPVLLLLIDVWPLKRVPALPSIALLREKLPLFALAAVAGIATFMVQSEVGAVGTLAQLPLSFRLSNAVLSYVRYAGQMIWPSGLAVFYPYPPSLPPWWQIAGASLIFFGISLVAIRERTRRPYLFTGWFWYVFTLLPVIGLLQSGDQLMADRFTYVPLIGLFIIVAWGASEILGRVPGLEDAAVPLGLVILVACAIVANRQVQFWKNSETLWRRALAVTAANHRAHAGLAEVLSQQGRTDAAIDEYRQALRIVADQAEWRNNLGLLYVRQNKIAEAMGQFAIATRVRPDFVDAHNNLGAMHARAGQTHEAIKEYTEAIRLAPGNALAHGNLARALASAGRLADALRECQEAIRLEPANEEWRRLAETLSSRSDKHSRPRYSEECCSAPPQPPSRSSWSRFAKRRRMRSSSCCRRKTVPD